MDEAKIPTVELVFETDFEVPYDEFCRLANAKKKGSIKWPKCVGNCPYLINHRSNFRKHLRDIHTNDYQLMIRNYHRRLQEEQGQGQQPEEAMDALDEELPEEDVALIPVENPEDVVKVFRIMFNNPLKSSYFFDNLKINFKDQNLRNYANRTFQRTVEDRFKLGIPFSSLSTILSSNIDTTLEFDQFVNPQLMSVISEFVESEHLQEVFVEKLGTYICPQELIIRGVVVGQKVSLIDLSRLILQNASILQSIIEEQQLLKDVPIRFENFDSELTCSFARWLRLIAHLRYQIGVDDFTLTKRSLGHKYIGVYIQFTNVPAKDRLKRRDCYLLCIVKRQKLKDIDATLNDVMQHIYDDMKKMHEEGVDISFTKRSGQVETVNIKGALSSICGDNLGEFEILGYHPYMFSSPNFRCRFCAIMKRFFKDLQIQNSKVAPLCGTDEDKAKYEAWLQNPDQENEFMLIQPCIFTSLPGVDVWNIGPPDILHDLAEGVIIQVLCDFAFDSVLLSKDDIVNRINNFPFYNGTFSARNENGKVKISKATAVQKLELLARFQEIFAGKIDFSHEGYKLLIKLQEFTAISFSYSISRDDHSKLETLAKEIVEGCLVLNPNYSINPKLHQILHYSQLVELFGPLVLYSTLKYERKHLYFKNWSDEMQNFINPPVSFATRHQQTLAVEMSNGIFHSTNFFPKIPQEILDRRSIPILTKLPAEFRPLSVESGGYPHYVTKDNDTIIFKFDEKRNYWICPTKYYMRRSDEKIIAEGTVFELKKKRRSYRQTPGVCEYEEVMEQKLKGVKFIYLNDMEHRIDFKFVHQGRCIFLKGMI